MSPLPERRKSAEEIARLRESIGVPQVIDAVTEAAPDPQPLGHSGPVDPASAGSSSTTPSRDLVALRTARMVPALGKSDDHPTDPAPSEDRAPSLDGGSKIPAKKHSKRELEVIRRRQALAAMQSPVVDRRLASAHPVVLAPGYLLALAGATCHLTDSFPAAATAGSALAGLIIAALVCWRFPSSRHHAAFIAVTALLVLVFGSLHFLPQFQHAP